jgi:hypothetical protein
MALASIRNIPLFIISATPFLAYYLRDLEYKKITLVRTKFSHGLIAFLLSMCLIFYFRNIVDTGSTYITPNQPLGAVAYIINNLAININNVKIFNEYGTGGFLEISGFKPYIDSRAEVFLKAVNNKENILYEYFNVIRGRVHYSQIEAKYKFTHFLLSKGTPMDTFMSHDNLYKKVYEDKMFSLYEPLVPESSRPLFLP